MDQNPLIEEETISEPLPPNKSTGQKLVRGIKSPRGRGFMLGAVLLAILLAGVAYIASRSDPPTKAKTDTTQLQDISADELKQFTNALLKPTTNQVINITPNAHFDNAVTVDKILTAGAISTQNLTITGPVNLNSVNINENLFVDGGTTLQGVVEARNQLNVRGALTAANASFSGNLAVAGTLTAGTLSVGDLTSKNLIVNGDLTVNGHLALLGGAVTGSPGPAIGNGNVKVFGNDTTGTIVITAGTSPVAGQMAIVNFLKPYPGVPHVTITPIGQNAGSLKWYATRASSFLSVDTITPPTAGLEYAFDYFVQR